MKINGVDPKRWLVFKAHGATRFLLNVQAYFDDVRGAVVTDDSEAAAYSAQITILKCFSIKSLATDGELYVPNECDEINFHPLAGIEPAVAHRWLAFCTRPLQLGWREEKMAWLQELEQFVRETERELGFARPFQELRSPRGLSELLRVGRIWDKKIIEMGLPSALPANMGLDSEI